MSRISFLVGFDRTAQSSSSDFAGPIESDANAKGQGRRNLSKKGEEHLAAFWEETRVGLVRRMREKNERDAASSAVLPASTAKQNLNLFVTSQIKKKVHAAKIVAARKSKWIVHPNDPRKLYWDLFVGVMIVYSIVVIPWRISFQQDASGGMLIFDYCVDCLFGIDIVLCFNSAYIEEDALVYKREFIARRYLSTWFVPDFLGTVPLGSLTNMFLSTVGSSSNLQTVKLLRVVRGIRMLKLMRILRLSRKMAQVDISRHINPSVVRLIKLLFKIMFAAHLLGCMWFLVDECDVDGVDQNWQHCGGHSLGSKYLASLYWTIATLMSVGYGDISANNNHERMFALGTMVIGSTAFGFIVAMVTVIVETMDPQATAKNAKMEEVREYMGVRKLTKNLQLRMRKHFDHVYQKTSVFKEVSMLRDLPYALRVKLAFDTHRELLRTLSFFENLDVPVITELVYRLKPMQMRRKEYVGKAGDILDDVFFVVKGRVEARQSKPGKQVLVALYLEGSDFELSSLVLCSAMQFSYQAVVQSDLMWLDKDDLETITIEYASAERIIVEKAEEQSKLLEKCLSAEEVLAGSDHRKAEVLVNWRLTPGEAISELAGDGAMSVVLDASLADDADDTTALIRTLRPIREEKARGAAAPPGHPAQREPEGVFVGMDWADEQKANETKSSSMQADENGPKEGGSKPSEGVGQSDQMEEAQSSSLKRRRSSTFLSKSADEEEEEERRERTPPNMEEALETAESVRRRWIILPYDDWKQKWDTFAVVLIALSVIVVPFRLGFDAQPRGAWIVVDYVTDVSFAFDIVLNFRMAYINGHVMVTSPGLIANNYFKGWFTVDILSTVPFDRIMSLAMGDEGAGVFRGLKLVKVVRTVRLLRLFRLLKLARFRVLTYEFMESNTVLLRGLKLVLTLALLGHFFGCFWSFVSIAESSADGGDGSATPSTWWESLGLQEDNLLGRYIASIYWAFTTMTTVGYGDILPVMDQERAYATVIMVIGATVFGYIVGSVSALASNPNGSQALETVKILAVSNYLEEKKVQQKLRQAVKKHVEYFMLHKSPFDEESLLALMPPNLRQESVLQIHKDVIRKIGMFKHLSPNCTAYLLRHMKPIFTLTGNYIYTPAHGSDGVYFLLLGVAEIVRQEEGTDRFHSLNVVQEGHCFGHDVLMQAQGIQAKGTRGARALTDCSMYLLSRTEIVHLMDTQPNVAAKLQRALRHVVSEQMLSSPREVAVPSSGRSRLSLSARAFVGGVVGQHREVGSAESARVPGSLRSRHMSSQSIRIPAWHGTDAKIVPSEGRGGEAV